MNKAIEHPRFISTTGKPVMLALKNSHTAAVTNQPEGSPLHPEFHRMALIRDCMPLAAYDAIKAASPEPDVEPKKEDVDVERRNKILAHINVMVAEADDSPSRAEQIFTADNKPSVEALNTALGIKIFASERDELWAEYQDSRAE